MPPYLCREGVCAMCMAKLTKGKVQMHNTQSLLETDLYENKIFNMPGNLPYKRCRNQLRQFVDA